VYTSEQEIVIMRHVGMSGIHLFTFLLLFTGNHHSRLLEGKYTFWEDLVGIQ